MVYDCWRRVARACYPPVCQLCGAPGAAGHDLCAGCRRDLPWNRCACRGCALPLDASADGGLCGRCIRRPPPFVRASAAFVYAQPLAWLLRQFKFNARFDCGRLLGELCAEQLRRPAAGGVQALAPVPLHPGRLRERGFNQSRILAQHLARRHGLPLLDSVRRVRATCAQSDLSAVQRRANVRAAFALETGLAGLRVAIVDDVMTTGATAGELARVLRRAGAGEVEVWVLARAQVANR